MKRHVPEAFRGVVHQQAVQKDEQADEQRRAQRPDGHFTRLLACIACSVGGGGGGNNIFHRLSALNSDRANAAIPHQALSPQDLMLRYVVRSRELQTSGGLRAGTGGFGCPTGWPFGRHDQTQRAASGGSACEAQKRWVQLVANWRRS